MALQANEHTPKIEMTICHRAVVTSKNQNVLKSNHLKNCVCVMYLSLKVETVETKYSLKYWEVNRMELGREEGRERVSESRREREREREQERAREEMKCRRSRL